MESVEKGLDSAGSSREPHGAVYRHKSLTSSRRWQRFPCVAEVGGSQGFGEV